MNNIKTSFVHCLFLSMLKFTPGYWTSWNASQFAKGYELPYFIYPLYFETPLLLDNI